MKGDFSRLTFDKNKHYSGVLMQQGRVQIDADWNEQQAIYRHRVETETQDVLGPSGAPIAEGGFEIGVTPDGSDLTLSSGRIYVDGILCELEATTLEVVPIPGEVGKFRVPITVVDGRPFEGGQWIEFSAMGQENYYTRLKITYVDHANRTLTCEDPDGTLAALPGGGATLKLRRSTTYITQPDYLVVPPSVPGFGNEGPCASLVYLDVWEQHVTALDDDHIREVALGVPDTATRSRTLWQARVLPPVDASHSALAPLLQTHVNIVSRLEELSSSPGHEQEVDKLRATLTDTDSQILKLLGVDCASYFEKIKVDNPPSTGRLLARTLQPEGAESPCDVPPHAGYDRLENQLYRVEIHEKGDRDHATFKWSRDNGSVATAVLEITVTTDGTPTSGEIKVRDLGRDDVLSFANNQLVELVDDTTELTGKAGPLLRIVGVDAATLTLRVEGDLPNVSEEDDARDLHYKLRRWDSSSVLKMPAQHGEFEELEGGIQVQFSEGTYNTGDYWLIPARAATDAIEWPNNQPQPPAGIHHHYAGLALIMAATVDGKRRLLVLSDCRRLFPPVTHESPAPESIQITQVRLVDPPDGADLPIDSDVNATDLAQGIEIVCDDVIDERTIRGQDTTNAGSEVKTSPTCLVTLEMPYPQSTARPYLSESHALSNIRGRLVALPTVLKVLAVAALVVLGLIVLMRLLSAERPPLVVLALLAFIVAVIVIAILLLWCGAPRREGTVVGFHPLILAADVGIANQQKNIIQWRPATQTSTWLRNRLFWDLGKLSVNRVLVRLSLKGNFIWRGDKQRPLAYLDGDIFGVPGEHTPIELQFPSGDGRQGGDFEMWFWLSQDNYH